MTRVSAPRRRASPAASLSFPSSPHSAFAHILLYHPARLASGKYRVCRAAPSERTAQSRKEEVGVGEGARGACSAAREWSPAAPKHDHQHGSATPVSDSRDATPRPPHLAQRDAPPTGPRTRQGGDRPPRMRRRALGETARRGRGAVRRGGFGVRRRAAGGMRVLGGRPGLGGSAWRLTCETRPGSACESTATCSHGMSDSSRLCQSGEVRREG